MENTKNKLILRRDQFRLRPWVNRPWTLSSWTLGFGSGLTQTKVQRGLAWSRAKPKSEVRPAQLRPDQSRSGPLGVLAAWLPCGGGRGLVCASLAWSGGGRRLFWGSAGCPVLLHAFCRRACICRHGRRQKHAPPRYACLLHASFPARSRCMPRPGGLPSACKVRSLLRFACTVGDACKCNPLLALAPLGLLRFAGNNLSLIIGSARTRKDACSPQQSRCGRRKERNAP